jgi:beta-glucosidase
MRKTVRKTHLIRRSICLGLSTVLLLVAIVLQWMAPSYLGMLDGFVSGVKSTATEEEIEETSVEANALSKRVEVESAVLLRNEENVLPFSRDTKKVNVFGWASTEWIGGGSGSGGVTSVEMDLLQALNSYGIETNTALSEMYEAFQSEREYTSTLHSWPEQSCRLYEPSIQDTEYYTEELLAEAEQFSDTAIVVIGRISGESNDATQTQYKCVSSKDEIVEDATRTYLDLSTEEMELLTYVGATYQNVVVLLNVANVMTLGALETISGIDACLMVGYTGQTGAAAIPELLWGEENPSGHTVDTWSYEFATAASYANAAADGVGAYSNADGLYPANGTNNGNLGEAYVYEQVSYLDYVEGIYVGYKWYETADVEGYWDAIENVYGIGYDGVVQYPFGYGLSYTTFEQTILQSTPQSNQTLDETTDKIQICVQVTNTGNRAGQDVVQLYYTAPYIQGQIEKSSVELLDFAKTKVLEPGESQELCFELEISEMASYDCYDKNENGFCGYELDAGVYQIKLMKNAHELMSEDSIVTYELLETIQFPEDSLTGLTVSNKFTGDTAMDGISLDGNDSEQSITYLTRADFVGTFPEVEVGKTRAMAENLKEQNLYTQAMADAWDTQDVEEVITGANNRLKVMKNHQLTDVGIQLGENYEDPLWEDVLDQLTLNEMLNLVSHGYSHTAGVASIGKELTLDADGPAQIGGFTGRNAGTGFPSSSTLAQSWNTELALEVGRMIGHQAAQNGYSGWYAPAVNLHRSPFNGRNYEYYSEDSYLSGQMCGNTVAGSLDAGTYCYVKHLICNDGEAGIYRDSIYIWMTEQTLRETYLEPFRIIVEEYGATGIMSSYNRIGAIWTGGSTALLTGILREEWNFKGAVITDYSDHHEFMNGDQMIRAGGDLWMDGVYSGSLQYETESNAMKLALRTASKNILYMVLNAQVENSIYIEETGDTALTRPIIISSVNGLWKTLLRIATAVAVVLFLWFLRQVILDVQEKRTKQRRDR